VSIHSRTLHELTAIPGSCSEAKLLYGGQNGCPARGYVDVIHYIRWLYKSVKI